MLRTGKTLLASFLLVFLATAAVQAATLEEIFAEVEKTSKSIKDMSCDITMEMDVMGQPIKLDGTMKMRLPNKFAMTFDMNMPGPGMKDMVIKTKMVSDGQVVYQEIDLAGQLMVNKFDAKAVGMNMGGIPGMGAPGIGGIESLAADASKSLEKLKKMMKADDPDDPKADDLKVLPDAKLEDGQKAWVLEGKIRPEFYHTKEGRSKGPTGAGVAVLKSQVAGLRIYIGQKSKFINKIEMLSSTGEKTGALIFRNLKFNQGLDDAVFKYVPPENVPVNDITEQMRRQMQAVKGAIEKTEASEPKTVDSGAPPSTLLRAGTAAPAFTVTTLEGKKVDLVGLRGKPVLLFFWATWHKDSVKQLAELNALQTAYKHRGLNVLALSLDEPGQADAVGKAVKENNISARVAIGNDAIWDAYLIREVPAYVLINAQGKALSSEVKFKDLSRLKKTLSEALK